MAKSTPIVASKTNGHVEDFGTRNGTQEDSGRSADEMREKQRQKARSSRRRAVKNWKRAKAAATRKVTEEMLGPNRR